MFNRLRVITTMIIFGVSFIVSGTAVSEETKPEREVRGYFMAGGTAFDLDPLNSRLGAKGYSEFSGDLFSVGGGFFTRVSDKVLTGFEGHLLVGEEKSSVIDGKRYSSFLIGGYGFFNTGYLMIENDKVDVFPIFGIGFGGVGVRIGQSSFDDILDNPHRAAMLSTFSFLVNLGLGADYKIALPGDTADVRFLILGVRGGYAFAPFKSGWYMDDISLSGDPEGGIEGPYVRLTIGGGGNFKLKMFNARR